MHGATWTPANRTCRSFTSRSTKCTSTTHTPSTLTSTLTSIEVVPWTPGLASSSAEASGFTHSPTTSRAQSRHSVAPPFCTLCLGEVSFDGSCTPQLNRTDPMNRFQAETIPRVVLLHQATGRRTQKLAQKRHMPHPSNAADTSVFRFQSLFGASRLFLRLKLTIFVCQKTARQKKKKKQQ